MPGTVQELSRKFYEDMVNIRHKLHMNPELGDQEHQTSRMISDVLSSFGIEVREHVARTGVVGLIRGARPGRTVLLRADMDALPIQEDVDVPYRSRIPGRMHACGHDGHVAGLLGAAMILNSLRGSFSGQVKLAFQPAEETEGGAARMIAEGILEDPHVDAAFGCHLWGPLREGEVQLCPGPMMASVDSFKFRILGNGGHSALPHLAVDPIPLAAQIITFFQTIVSRRVSPLEPAVLTISSIHSGEADNVIPGTVVCGGTVRSFSETLREAIPREMEAILKGVTEAQGASYEFEYQKVFPALINDPGMTRLVRDAFAKIVGASHVNDAGAPVMGSEDFAYFCQSVPSAFAMVGIAGHEAAAPMHHHPKFQWEDRNLLTLSKGMAQIALDFLALPPAGSGA